MYKHIKVLARPYGADSVEVVVVEQTHIVWDFGTRGLANRCPDSRGYCHEESKVHLRSYQEPQVFGVDEGYFLVYLRGYNKSENNRTLRIPADKWERVKSAIEAYNEEFKE